jgi:hypothetical protein
MTAPIAGKPLIQIADLGKVDDRWPTQWSRLPATKGAACPKLSVAHPEGRTASPTIKGCFSELPVMMVTAYGGSEFITAISVS